MKKMFTRIAVMTLALLMSVGYVVPEIAFAADMDNPTATNVKYATDSEGVKTGIKSFTIEPYTYLNLEPGETVKLDDSKLNEIAATQIFPRWSLIANEVFRDQANQLVTIEGSGMMSSDKNADNSFDKHFNIDKEGVSDDYVEYDWSIRNLAEQLARTSSRHDGKTCWDEMRATGITAIGSLKDARTLMGQELRNCSDDNDVSVDDFLGNSNDQTKSEYRLPALADDKTETGSGFASIVTSVNRKGASGDYDYVSMGLAVYDFELVPIAANDLRYVEAANKIAGGSDILMGKMGNYADDAVGIKFAENDSTATQSYLKNTTPNKSKHTSALKNTITESTTISTQDTFQWSQTQSVGSTINTWIYGLGDEGAPMLPRATITFGFSWSQMWSTTKGKATSRSNADDKTISSELELPPYTVAKITQNAKDKLTQEVYQQPVVLSYKVAIFAMSGDYYNGASGGITSSRYDKQWMNVIFDGTDASETSGNSALGSLYNRAVVNKNTQGYDGAKGKLNSWCDKAAWNKSNKIDWKSIAADIAADTRSNYKDLMSSKTGKRITLENISTELPLLESASNLKSNQVNMSASLDQIVAYYPLKEVVLKKDSKVYNTKPHETVYLDGIELQGLNEKRADFYGFKQNWGEWKVYDADSSEVVEDNSKKDKNPEPGKIKFGKFTLNNNSTLKSQYVIVDDDAGNDDKVYLKWIVDPSNDTKIMDNDTLTDTSREYPYLTPEEKKQIETPVIQLKVADATMLPDKVEIDGSYSGIYTDKVNLGEKLTARVLDTTGKVRGFPICWDSQDIEGIKVEKNGDAEFSKPGTYKVRAFTYGEGADKLYSNWLEIEARRQVELANITLEKPEFDDDDLTITKKQPYRAFNLPEYVGYYDQYGDKYTGFYDESIEEGSKWVTRDVPEIEFTVDDDGEGAYIDSSGKLIVTAPGTYKISARAYNTEGGNKNYLNYKIAPIKINVSREDWLKTIKLEKPAKSQKELTLEDKDDYIVIEDLASQLKYYDQDSGVWEGKKPAVTFDVNADSNRAEISNGNLYIYEPGSYTLSASASGYNIDPVNIQVTESRKLVIKTNNPSMIKITAQDTKPSINLESFVEYTTPFGGKYKGDNPELAFTLDSGVKGAKIESLPNIDKDTGKDYGNYPALTITEAGEYTVHVKVKKASEYSEKIDDIIVKADKYKSVGRVTLGFMDGDLELAVNTYDENPSTDITLKGRLEYWYWDQAKEEWQEIDPGKERVAVPEVRYSFYGDNIPSKDEAIIKDGVLTVFKPGEYAVKVEPEKADVQGSVAVFEVQDITWTHNFGGWEPAYPAAPDACDQDTWVKKCQGHDTDDDGVIDKECDYTVSKTLNAPGHRWAGEFTEEPDKTYTRDEIPEGSKIIAAEVAAEPAPAESEPDSADGSNGEGIDGSSESAQENAADNSEVYYKRAYIKCSECGAERDTVYYPENCSLEMTAATCSKAGSYQVLDGTTVLGEGEIPAIGHAYSFDVTKAATCKEEGTEALKCNICNEVKEGSEITIPKTKHDPLGEPAKVIEPTCTEEGFEYSECRHCHEVVPGGSIPAKGHTWDAGKVTKKATTTSTGVRTYTCTVCKETKTEVIAKLPKKANTLKVSPKTATVKYSKLKTKAQTLSVGKVIKFTKKGQGKLTYAKVSGNKKITINKKTGKVTVKKGLKKGTYKIKLKVTAAGNASYKAASRTAVFKIRVK